MIPIFLSCSYTFSPIPTPCSLGLPHPAVAHCLALLFRLLSEQLPTSKLSQAGAG